MQWVNKCQESHVRCSKYKNEIWFPTRLLDVRFESDSQIIKVVEVCNLEEPVGLYNTLSHAWGDGNFLKLTRDTQSSLETGVTLDLLTKTFQDAVMVCQRMGVHFLWIDCLCILQDDHSEWQRESGLMHKIYASAHCNISATSCTSEWQGLFRDRDPRLMPPVIEVLPPSRLPKGVYRLKLNDYYEKQLHGAPLHRRAWVLQERLLSKRIIHFTEHEIMWECFSLTASESWPSGIPRMIDGAFKDLYGKKRERHRLQPSIFGGHIHLYQLWQEVQEMYSISDLTFANDRMTALFGVARAFEKLLEDRYIYGMWKRNLMNGLFWRTQSFDTPRSPVQGDKNAPSFSWLSLETGSYGPGISDGPRYDLAKVLNIVLNYSSERQFSHHGEIFMQGILRAVRLVPKGSSDERWGVQLLQSSETIQAYPDWTRVDLPEDSTGREHYILPLGQGGGNSRLYGLVLERLPDHAPAFRRIGVFDQPPDVNWFWKTDPTQEILDIQTGQEHYPCEVYDPETMRHTICIR